MLNFDSQLLELEQIGNLRKLRSSVSEGKYLHFEGKCFLNLSSNDYLGVACRTDWQEEFMQLVSSCRTLTLGSTSSRLLTGGSPIFFELEQKLANAFGKEAALVFNSGYHANIGILPALSSKRDLILADKLVHASIIDGLKLCDAHWERFRHNDLEHLERLLVKNRASYDRVFIVTESVFSMDGDLANLLALCELKQKYDAFLYVDEAHAFGVLGAKGLGLCELTNTTLQIDLIVGTFGKAAASQGAYLVANRSTVDFLVNSMRSLIFSTAMAPISVMWTSFVVDRLAFMADERHRLERLGCLLREQLGAVGAATRGCSHVVPIVVGDNQLAISLAQNLQENGFWVLPIRYPTVPKGEARVRVSLTPAITDDEIYKLTNAVAQWKQNG